MADVNKTTDSTILRGGIGHPSPQVYIQDIDFSVMLPTTANEYKIVTISPQMVVKSVTLMMLKLSTVAAPAIDIGWTSTNDTIAANYLVGVSGSANLLIPTCYATPYASPSASAGGYIWLSPEVSNPTDGIMRIIVEYIDCSGGG